jgi:hypothetical protein
VPDMCLAALKTEASAAASSSFATKIGNCTTSFAEHALIPRWPEADAAWLAPL